MGEPVPIGTGNARCPRCGEIVPFDVLAEMVDVGNARELHLEPGLADIWAHAFTHEDNADTDI